MFYKFLPFVLAVLCFSLNTQAQEFEPILNPNAVWTQGVSGGWPNGMVTYNYEKLRLQGDTSINGISYQKMYATPNEPQFNTNNANYEFAIREDVDGKVWIRRQQDNKICHLKLVKPFKFLATTFL